jgi:hypothetical protein
VSFLLPDVFVFFIAKEDSFFPFQFPQLFAKSGCLERVQRGFLPARKTKFEHYAEDQRCCGWV